MEPKLGVALVKELCPVCCKELDGPIIMNTRLTKSEASKVEAMHNKVIGFSDKLCEDCQKIVDKGGFFFIEIDPSKTEDFSNPWRTGRMVAFKKESELYKSLDDKFKTRDMTYIDIETFNLLFSEVLPEGGDE